MLLLALACASANKPPEDAAATAEPRAKAENGAAAKALPAAPGVTIYLSTGANEGISRCDSMENTNCDLYAVELELGSKTARKVEKIATAGTMAGEPAGLSEATLSPSEDRLVWLERNHRQSRLVGMDLATKKTHTIVDIDALRMEGEGRGRTEWPEFVSDKRLVFDATTRMERDLELKTVYTMDVSDFAHPGQPIRQMGELGKDGVKLGSQDAAVWRGPGAPKIATFGPNPRDGKLELAPRVETLGDDGAPGPDVKVFDLGTNQSGERITECHHPAWNYAGNAILCMVHQPVELIEGVMTRLLYTYTQDAAGNWGAPKRTFEPVRLDKIGTDSAPLFADLASFERETYKYAQWCGNDDYVVATVFSSSKSKTRRGEDPFTSRVMLIRTNPVTYTDITSMIEQAEGRKVGELSSFTATCSREK